MAFQAQDGRELGKTPQLICAARLTRARAFDRHSSIVLGSDKRIGALFSFPLQTWKLIG